MSAWGFWDWPDHQKPFWDLQSNILPSYLPISTPHQISFQRRAGNPEMWFSFSRWPVLECVFLALPTRVSLSLLRWSPFSLEYIFTFLKKSLSMPLTGTSWDSFLSHMPRTPLVLNWVPASLQGTPWTLLWRYLLWWRDSLSSYSAHCHVSRWWFCH